MTVIPGWQVASLANNAGFVNTDLRIIVAVARAETGWDTDYLFKGPETEERGLFGINWHDHTDLGRLDLMDPSYNAWAARQIFVADGYTYVSWQSFTDGAYNQWLSAADDAIAQYQSLGGSPGNSPAPPTSTEPPPILTGLFPNFGPFDPAPFVRRFGDILHDWNVRLNDVVTSIYNAMQ